MGKTAHGDALGGCAIGQWVDFDVVAEGVGFVAEVVGCRDANGREVPTRETVVRIGGGVPALAGARSTGDTGTGHTVTATRFRFFGVDCG